MKRLLPLLLCLTLHAVSERTFLLPDNAHDARAHLRQMLHSARQHIVIVTPLLKTSGLTETLGEAAERGVNITLITAGSADDAQALVRFAAVRLLNLGGLRTDRYEGDLATTIVVTDGAESCLGTFPLERNAMEHDIGLLECSGDPARAGRYGQLLETLTRRAVSYLQP